MKMLRVYAALMAAATLFWASASEAQTRLKGTKPAQWRVIWTDSPRTSAVVAWSTRKSGSSHKVYWGAETVDGSSWTMSGTLVEAQNFKYQDSSVYGHYVRLTDLPPGKTIYFTLESDDDVSREFHFKTAPVLDSDFSILFGADSRAETSWRKRVNLLISELTDERPDLLAFAHGGDYVLSGKSWEDWSEWLSYRELATAESGRILPIIPARGNHDEGPLFNQVFISPGEGGNNYFVSELSTRVGLVTLNTNISGGSGQDEFLDAALASQRQSKRWLLALYHGPMYPALNPPTAQKDTWVPLFEAHNLDLAMEADGHTIKRTVPIRDSTLR